MTTIEQDQVAGLVRDILPLIDSDHDREGLENTPKRYAKFLREFLEEKPFNCTTFASEGYDEMVLQSDIPFFSICEHHLVPFFGHATIAYIPNQKIVGLSKLARTLTHYSHKLQNQERITKQVADFLDEKLQPKGVGVILTGRHMCMEMRGVEKPGTKSTTSYLKGSFRTDPATRAEFLKIK